jgi:hypothetical protein
LTIALLVAGAAGVSLARRAAERTVEAKTPRADAGTAEI